MSKTYHTMRLKPSVITMLEAFAFITSSNKGDAVESLLNHRLEKDPDLKEKVVAIAALEEQKQKLLAA